MAARRFLPVFVFTCVLMLIISNHHGITLLDVDECSSSFPLGRPCFDERECDRDCREEEVDVIEGICYVNYDDDGNAAGPSKCLCCLEVTTHQK